MLRLTTSYGQELVVGDIMLHESSRMNGKIV